MAATLAPWVLGTALGVLAPLAAASAAAAAGAASSRLALARAANSQTRPATVSSSLAKARTRLRDLAGNPAVWLAPVLAIGSAGANAERALAALILGVPVGNPGRTPGRDPHRAGGGKRSGRAWLANVHPSGWRDAAYVLQLVPASVAWAVPLVGLMLAVTLLSWSFWAGPQEKLALWALSIPIHTPGRRLVSVITGMTVLVLVTPLIRWLGGVRARLARHLLDPSSHRNAGLAAELAEQRAMRDAAVRAHTTDSQRIERDLHDGAQARLTALIMDLGRARKKLRSDPAGAQALVDDAYQAARQALAELRNLARGIQPPMLTDRGLDAAISALAARTPLPVEVDVAVPVRPPAPVESAAYFIVAEALANITKHAHASRARIRIANHNDHLVIDVSDDGVGGATIAGTGSGLAGLADRATALNGRFVVTSPPGGHTTVHVELPCAS